MLKSIHEQIERGLRRIGIRAEKEEFVPHITLARLKGSGILSVLLSFWKSLKTLKLAK